METKEKNKLKLLWALPLLILPFLALAFYALGGGRKGANSGQNEQHEGINTNLPDAKFKKADPKDKLSFYEVSERDSVKLKSQGESSFSQQEHSLQAGSYYPSAKSDADESERQINAKLEQINREINRPVSKQPAISNNTSHLSKTSMNGGVDRLEKLMRSMQNQQSEDPELQQLSGMLDKIIAIQNPEIANEKLKDKARSVTESPFIAIPVMIDGDQKVGQGGVVKLKLLDTILIRDMKIPKNQSLFGACNIVNQRLLLTIKNIRIGNSIVPVDLTVFSLDGMLGINAPEAELNEAAENGVNAALQNMEFITMDPSMGGQAANAGINAAKGLLNKKVKRTKVKLKGGEPLLLRNNQPSKSN
ncbi:MAG TPA: conjugative transposon protein TraM [Pedobacter sp.]|jgi:hypothetical protein